MNKIHFITYGDNNFKKSRDRLYREAIQTKWFDTVKMYSYIDLTSDFVDKYKNILEQKCGGGYWIWKYDIIKQRLNEIDENDILIYLDAGCSINIKGKNRLYEYINMLNTTDTGIISFQMEHTEKIWTTNEIFNFFNVIHNKDVTDTGQIVGGILIMKKNNCLLKQIQECYNVLENDSLLFTDYYDKKQGKEFRQNRFDQSIFSVIRKINNPILIKDETYFTQFGSIESLQYPFWATRIRM